MMRAVALSIAVLAVVPSVAAAQTPGTAEARLRSIEARLARLEASTATGPAATTIGEAPAAGVQVVRFNNGSSFSIEARGCVRQPYPICRVVVTRLPGGSAKIFSIAAHTGTVISKLTGADGNQFPATAAGVANDHGTAGEFVRAELDEGERASFDIQFKEARVAGDVASLTLKTTPAPYSPDNYTAMFDVRLR